MALALALLPRPGVACGIVYGSDWAFLAQTPEAWTAACGDKAIQKTALTLWPSSQTPDRADALMYVTVSGKGGRNLQEFADQELTRFKASSRASVVSELPIAPSQIGTVGRLVHIAGAQADRDEHVAYIEGPTSFFIVVLSADSARLGQRYRPAFDALLAGFYPMARTHDDG